MANTDNLPITDSGQRTHFSTGAVREEVANKGKFDYVSAQSMTRLLSSLEFDIEYYKSVNNILQKKYSENIDDAVKYLIDTIYFDLYNASIVNCDYEKTFLEFGHDVLSTALFFAMELIEFQETGAFFNLGQEANVFVIPPTALEKIAVHYEKGAAKYAPFNWAKGIKMSRYYDSSVRHFNQYVEGKQDEPHLVASAWNIMGLIHTQEVMPGLNDMHVWEKESNEK